MNYHSCDMGETSPCFCQQAETNDLIFDLVGKIWKMVIRLLVLLQENTKLEPTMGGGAFF